MGANSRRRASARRRSVRAPSGQEPSGSGSGSDLRLAFGGAFAYLAAHHTRRRSATRGEKSRAFPFRALEREFCLRRRTGRRNLGMALPEFSMRQLLEAGRPLQPPDAHRWNPKMERYIFEFAVQHSHHRPVADDAAATPGAGQGARSRRVGRPRAVRRHQAPGLGAGGDGGQTLRAILRQSPLARRHADQLAHHFGVHRPASRTGGRAGESGKLRPPEEGAAAA